MFDTHPRLILNFLATFIRRRALDTGSPQSSDIPTFTAALASLDRFRFVVCRAVETFLKAPRQFVCPLLLVTGHVPCFQAFHVWWDFQSARPPMLPSGLVSWPFCLGRLLQLSSYVHVWLAWPSYGASLAISFGPLCSFRLRSFVFASAWPCIVSSLAYRLSLRILEYHTIAIYFSWKWELITFGSVM